MKKILSYISLLLGLMMMAPAVSAQQVANIPKRNEAYRPEMVTLPSISYTMAMSFPAKKYGQGGESSQFAKDYWDVLSDRDRNQTFVDPKGKKPFATLSFREPVRIAAIRNDYALVYAIPDGNTVNYPNLPLNVQWKGWVPMTNLILWDHALCENNGDVMKFLVSNVVKISTPSDNLGKLFKHPTEPRDFVPLPSSPKSIFYLLKEEGNMVLLSEEKSIAGNINSIYGWVDKSTVLYWPSRVALEPTWEIQDVEAFAESGVSSEIFPNELREADSKLGYISFEKREMPSYRTEFYRGMGSQWRYPLLQPTYSDISVCALPVNSPYLDKNRAADTVADEDALGANLNHVNIVYVLDGSRAYEQYYPLISDHFKDLRLALADFSTRVGVQFYRDVRNEEFVTEYQNLVDTRSRDIESFLSSGGSYGYRENSSNPALLKGIADVLDKAAFDPSETNVVIVIGGKGDAADDGAPLPKQLAERLDATNVSLYGIQLQNNPSSSMYELFGYQLKDMLYAKLDARVRKVATDLDVVIQADRKSDDGLGHVTYALNDASASYAENHVYPVEGMLDEEVFVNQLNKIYAEIARDIKQKKMDLTSDESGLSQLFARVIMNSYDRANRQFFKQVAAYDEDELKVMMDDFAPFYEMWQTNNYFPGSLYAELLRLLDRIPQNVEIKADDWGCYEVFRMYEGIESATAYFKGWKLKEIKDGKVFTSDHGKMFLDQFASQYRKLLEIVRNPYPNTTRINGKLYYWIPVEYLP